MNFCLKMILPLFLGGSISFFSFHAQAAFEGCDHWCGKKAGAATVGMTPNAPDTVAKDREVFQACMAQTRAEHSSVEECDNKPAPVAADNVPTPSANPNKCVTEYNDIVGRCDAQISSATTSCDQDQNSALKSAMASASSAGADTSASVADSCKNAESVSSSAKDAMTSYRDQCQSAVNSCSSTCGELVTWANSNPTCFPLASGVASADALKKDIYSPKADKCMDLDSKVTDANTAIGNYASNSTTSEQCKTATTGGASNSTLGQLASMATSLLGKKETATETAVQPTFCELNPSAPGCAGAAAAVNCSDPTAAASNKVCICSANPNSPVCLAGETSSASTVASAMIDSSSRLATQTDSSGLGDIPNLPSIPQGRPSSGGGDVVDGNQGGGSVGSSTVGAGGGGSQGNRPTTVMDDPLAPGGGGYGSGGRGGASASGRTYGGGERFSGNSAAAGTSGAPVPPDLRQFLPGGLQDPKGRGLAGSSGIDGITGPHSNIWQKVQNRYRILQDTLQP